MDTIFYSNSIRYSLTLSLTSVLRRSVSLTISILISNSYYNSFNENEGTFQIITTRSDYQLYIPYIIYFYSPIYVPVNMSFYIVKRKGLTGEQLIGVTCGSVAVFFIILYIMIIINRQKVHHNENWYKLVISSESGSKSEITEEYKEVGRENNDENDESYNEDSELDFWL